MREITDLSEKRQEIERFKELLKIILKALDGNLSAVSKLIGKLYNINDNTLRIYLSRSSFMDSNRRKLYLKMFEDFYKKYNNTKEIKQAYYKVIYGADKDFVLLREELRKKNFKCAEENAIDRIKKAYPNEIFISTKNGVSNRHFIHKNAIDRIDKTLITVAEDVWKEVLKLRNELLKRFEDRAKFCWYLADMSDLTQNSIHTTLFYRVDRQLYNCKKINVANKYLKLLNKAKIDLKNTAKK